MYVYLHISTKDNCST